MSSHIDDIPLDNIPYAIICIKLGGEIHASNSSVEGLTGYSKVELLGKNITFILPTWIHPEQNKAGFINPIESESCLIVRDTQLLSKSHHYINCSIKISNTASGFIIFIDKQNNNIVKGSFKTARKRLNSIDEAFWEWDIKEDIIHYSQQAMSLLGYDSEAYTGQRTLLEGHLSDQDLASLYMQVQHHCLGNISCINPTFSITTKQGTIKWVTVVGKIFEYENGKPLKMFGSVKDVSESQKLIHQLKKQNSYLQLAEKLSHSGHWHLNLKENSLHWSKGIFDIHGLDSSTFIPTVEAAVGFYKEGEQSKINEHLENAIKFKKGFYFKSAIYDTCGNVVKVESLGEVELDSDGDVIGVFGVFRDITKSEMVFEKLKLLAMVNYTIKVPIFFIDDHDNVVYQDLSPQMGNDNNVLFNYINFSKDDYLNYKVVAKENGQLKQSNISFDKYNSVFDLSITYEQEEGIFIWIVENVTEKFRREQQQLISNRLTLLGNTFGNVSHDINNVLGVALGAVEMLEIKFSQGEQNISSYIDRVKNAVDKGKSVTERLLAFTHKPTVKLVEFDPIQEIKDNRYIFEQLLFNTIKLDFSLAKVSCQIKFPQGEFINVLLNLMLNAQDAIKEKKHHGLIQLRANINDEGQFEVHLKDSGVGIKDENLSKIFDPFYSSKTVNKGNGIGLANVYSLIYKHDGQIRVSGSSDIGGAEFTLVFQCTMLEDNQRKNKAKDNSLALKGKSILILDDEQSIAEFVALYLDSEGANTEYISTEVQLQNILKTDLHFDIFITDMILPDISGPEATKLVLEKFPAIKVYSMSGYIAEDEVNWQYPVLRKPFNSKELAIFINNH